MPANKPPKITIIAADFNPDVVSVMIRAARAELKSQGANLHQLLYVSGSYELPLITQAVLQKKDCHAIVILGFIEKGRTLHGEVMGYVVHDALIKLQLKYKKPIGLGLIGPGATLKQAQERANPNARAAARAAIKNLELLNKIG